MSSGRLLCATMDAATAAIALTIPLEIGAGFALQSSPTLLRVIGACVALAQLCRFGPLWATIGTTVADEVRGAITAARRREQ